MDEYIERKVVINRIKEYTLDVYDIDLDDAKQFGGNSRIENYCEGLYEATELVDDIPAADVATVRHGRWEKQRGIYSCSECGMTCPYDVQADVIEYWACNYCPNCGAKIDKEEE